MNNSMIQRNQAVILDDQQLFTDSFSSLLNRYKVFDHVHTYYRSEDFIQFLLRHGNKEIYIFLDYYLKDDNGLSVFSDIKRFCKKAKIIFVTSTTSSSILNYLILAQPEAILSKSCSMEVILRCLENVKNGVFFFDEYLEEFVDDNARNIPNFTIREIELLRYFTEGLSIAQTAEKTFLSKHTIIAHRRKMMAKANCHSIGQLVKIAKDLEIT
ncbi:LuxR C-terminal-related transcriptional regulator [Sphingobacterium hungaricum]